MATDIVVTMEYQCLDCMQLDSITGLVPYSYEQAWELVHKLCRYNAHINCQDEADVGPDLMFPVDVSNFD